MLLFALWFQDKHAAAGIKSHNYQLNIFVFSLHDFIPCFLAKKCVCYYCKLIKSNVYKKYSITARELVFTILDRSVSCLLITPKT